METLTGSFEDLEWIPVEDASAATRVRGVASALARRLGFSDHRVGEIAIAATELATNTHRHAAGGTILVRAHRRDACASVELIASDSGPGFANLNVLARDGNSTAGTLGIGLGAVMRLATWFDAQSTPGRGTVIAAAFGADADEKHVRMPIAVLTRNMNNESVCGDAMANRGIADGTLLLAVDGLGHGELAAVASRAAINAFLDDADDSPGRVLARLDRAMRATRGAAALIVRLEPARNQLTFTGVGNIAGWIDDGDRRHGLISTPGIVGHNARKFRELVMPWLPGSLLVLHSDGLTSKWDLNAYPGLRTRDPLIVAATLMRDAGIRHDDASVLVARA